MSITQESVYRGNMDIRDFDSVCARDRSTLPSTRNRFETGHQHQQVPAKATTFVRPLRFFQNARKLVIVFWNLGDERAAWR